MKYRLCESTLSKIVTGSPRYPGQFSGGEITRVEAESGQLERGVKEEDECTLKSSFSDSHGQSQILSLIPPRAVEIYSISKESNKYSPSPSPEF